MVFRAENAGRTPSQNRFEPAYLALHRRGDLQVRVEQARRELAECHICPRLCEVDRLAGQMGVCKIDRHARVASYFPHFGEEDCLRGWAGSGFTDDIAAPNSFSLDDGGTKTFLDVLAGSYTITEDDPGPGYTLTALACVDPSGGTSVSLFTRTASIDLAVGETVECTFTNTASASAAVTVSNLPPSWDSSRPRWIRWLSATSRSKSPASLRIRAPWTPIRPSGPGGMAAPAPVR